MKVWNGTAWIDGSYSVAADEVFIGPSAPPTTYELWVDDDEVGVAPAGVLGYAETSAAQNGIGTAWTDVTGLSLPITVVAGRRLRISTMVQTTIAATAAAAHVGLMDAATYLQQGSHPLTAAAYTNGFVSVVVTPSAGLHTYKTRVACNSGTINVPYNRDPGAAMILSWLLVEDIGGV